MLIHEGEVYQDVIIAQEEGEGEGSINISDLSSFLILSVNCN